MELNVSVEDLRKKKLFVATPCYAGQCHGIYTKSTLDLQALCTHYGIEIRFSFLFNESLITRARNYMADEFLRSPCTHLLFIDSDIGFDANDVITMLAMDRDVLGGPYPKKSISWSNVLKLAQKPGTKADDLPKVTGDYVFNPVPGTQSFDVREPLEVMETGTGFMMIKREVFLKFKEEYPHLQYRPDHTGQFDMNHYIHAFFDCYIEPEQKRYLSEDYAFCRRWRDIGGQVWYCPWMRTTHMGAFGFEGDMPTIANLLGNLRNE